MKNLLFLIIIFEFNLQIKSQTIYIKDSLDLSPIAFSEIIINDNIYHSDSMGKFEFQKPINNFTVRKSGFYPKKIEKLSTEIFLSPKINLIQKVEIAKRKLLTTKLKVKKNNTHTIPLGMAFGFKINNPYGKDGLLKEISIPIKRIFNNNKATLIIEFYNIENGIITKDPQPNSSIFINVDTLETKNNTISISDKYIIFPSEGIFLSLQVVEEFGTTNFKISKPSITFMNTINPTNYYFKDPIKNGWNFLHKSDTSIGISFKGLF